MHILAALGELPFSMLVTLFALATSALPVETSELTPQTFGPAVNNGLWFIEYYSPYCGHCKHFKPTWEQLIMDSEKEIPTMRFGTINCILHGDLCSQNGVKSWPSLLMFDQGKVIGHYEGPRELDELKKFMKQYVKEEPAQLSVSLSSSTPASTVQTSPEPSTSSLIKHPLPPVVNLAGEVLVLDSDLFETTLSKGSAFVKFFAPWCGHCKKMAPIWKQLARHMQGKLTIAEVNCDNHSSICKSQGIEAYPTLIYYDSNGVKSEYNGGRKIDQLKTFTERAAAAGVQMLDTPDELDTHVVKEDVVYLLLHSPVDTDADILKFVGDASAPLLGSPAVYASSSPELHSRFSIPPETPWSITVLKDHDTHLPTSTFYGSNTVTQEKLKAWLLTHRLPTTLELTQDTFQTVMNAPQSPLVVIAAARKDEGDKVKDQFRELAKKWRLRTEGSGIVHRREVVFTWMDVDAWGSWMKSMYGIQSNDNDHHHQDLEDVKVVIADHSKLIYYDTDRLGSPIKMSASSKLFAAIDDAASGKSSYKHSENVVERVARFLSNKIKSIETFVLDRPFHALLILVIAVAVIFWVLHRLIGNDTSLANLKEYKGKNARLD